MVRRLRDAAERVVHKERRRSPRASLACPATLRAADLTLHGDLSDFSSDGAFLATRLLIEVGERGTLEAKGGSIAVEVVWLRGNSDAEGPGMGLIFVEDPTSFIGSLTS